MPAFRIRKKDSIRPPAHTASCPLFPSFLPLPLLADRKNNKRKGKNSPLFLLTLKLRMSQGKPAERRNFVKILQENQQKEGETGAECRSTLQRQNLQPKLGQLKPVVIMRFLMGASAGRPFANSKQGSGVRAPGRLEIERSRVRVPAGAAGNALLW